MMKKLRILHVLLGACVALGALLAALWVDSSFQWRNVNWQKPEPLRPDLQGLTPTVAPPRAVDISRFVMMLDRPLFAVNRRPPPPKPVASDTASAQPDPLAGIHIFGLFGGEQSGGMLARIDGKIRRVAVKENFGGWVLQSVKDREATVERNGEVRVLPLVQARPTTVARPAGGSPPPGGAAVAPEAGAPAAAAAPAGMTAEQRAQQAEEAQRERLRRRNEFRAKAGAAPLN